MACFILWSTPSLSLLRRSARRECNSRSTAQEVETLSTNAVVRSVTIASIRPLKRTSAWASLVTACAYASEEAALDDDDEVEMERMALVIVDPRVWPLPLSVSEDLLIALADDRRELRPDPPPPAPPVVGLERSTASLCDSISSWSSFSLLRSTLRAVSSLRLHSCIVPPSRRNASSWSLMPESQLPPSTSSTAGHSTWHTCEWSFPVALPAFPPACPEALPAKRPRAKERRRWELVRAIWEEAWDSASISFCSSAHSLRPSRASLWAKAHCIENRFLLA